MTMTRAFIAIPLPSEIQKKVGSLQTKLPPFTGKATNGGGLHLTLKFLGEIDEKTLATVRERLRSIDVERFTMKSGKLGVFSPSMVRILWVSLLGSEPLQQAIDGALEGFFKKEKSFMGHLTIGRVKKLANKRAFLEALDALTFPSFSFPVESFILYSSTLRPEGPEYKVIEEFSLK